MIRLLLLLALLASPATAAGRAPTQLGAGFNGQLGDINNALIVKSGVRWVRVFVDVTRNHLAYSYDGTAWITTGPLWNNICQPGSQQVASEKCPTSPQDVTPGPNRAGELSNIIPVYALGKLIATKSLGCQAIIDDESTRRLSGKTSCQDVKIILSLKTDFTYFKATNILSDTTFTSQGFVIDAVLALLQTGLGQYIDILVLGNEPMFEVDVCQAGVPAPGCSAPNPPGGYQVFLHQLAKAVYQLREANSGWSFQMFTGSLDRPAAADVESKLPIANAVINATKSANALIARDAIAGIDLHEHVEDIDQVSKDAQWVTAKFRNSSYKPTLISTEFSLILYWSKWLKQSPSLCVKINKMITDAASGSPQSGHEFRKYLGAQPWYQEGWFKRFYCAFDANKFKVVTYGIERANQYPYTLDLSDCKSNPWVLISAYNGALLGISRNTSTATPTAATPHPTPSFGFFNENPLVFPDFAQIIAAQHGRHPGLCDSR